MHSSTCRLNARVTELAAELATVTARAEELQLQVDRQQELHGRESKVGGMQLLVLWQLFNDFGMG